MRQLHPAPRTFFDVVVGPTQEVLKRPAGAFFRGGPVWPAWWRQVAARQCRGILPVPFDRKPHGFSPPEETRAEGVWCGPVCWHYGHTVADFSMRVAASAAAFPTRDVPFVFSIWENEDLAPSRFFWPILEHLGVDLERVLLVRRPIRFAKLHVLPQAERRWGGGPSARHLDLMDALAGAAAVEKTVPHLYVSRSTQPTGRIAGEGYLDRCLSAVGVAVFHPETASLADQIALYGRSRSLVFAEGSAVHTLQLMGRLGSDVAVLVRRPTGHLAAASLRPRVGTLRYLDALRGVVHGLRPSGKAYQARGISVPDGARLVGQFASVGIDLSGVWDEAAFRAARDADIAAWMETTRRLALHPRAIDTAERCLRRLGLS